MRLLAPAVLLGLGVLVVTGLASAARPLPAQDASSSPLPATITLPPGTKVTLALTSPVWAKKVKAGDPVYAMTAFPAVVGNTMAIPAGTYVQGQIDAVIKPSWKDARALFQMHFGKIIFANGYTFELAGAPVQAATATVHVKVTSRNDLLLDNGEQFEMVIQMPLALETNRVADAVRLTKPLTLGAAKSATACRLIPATPGTSDTVIPGTPGTSGTPDIIIPGPNGTSTTIPGIPPTPGTPPTIIPGTPGTPAIPCPAQPAVVSGPSGPQIHRQSFQVTNELMVSGKKLMAGTYEIAWMGPDVVVHVDLQKDGKTIVRVPAHITSLEQRSAADKTVTRANADGSSTIASLEFASESFGVIFD